MTRPENTLNSCDALDANNVSGQGSSASNVPSTLKQSSSPGVGSTNDASTVGSSSGAQSSSGGVVNSSGSVSHQTVTKSPDDSVSSNGVVVHQPQHNNNNSNNNNPNHHASKSLDDTSTNYLTSSNNSTSTLSQMSKDLIFNAENKSRLSLLKTCIALIPRLMPAFKESELVDILTRLTIHLDDELRIITFQTLRILTFDYPHWRKAIFTGFTNFILKEIGDMYGKLGENALKMLVQLLSTWKLALSVNSAPNSMEECCQIIHHLEGFSLFTLCHSQLPRRRYALIILRECKLIGELVKCFKSYPFHNYAVDVLDLASIHAMKHLHLQCFNSNLTITNVKPDLHYLIEQSANWETSVNSLNYSVTQPVDSAAANNPVHTQISNSLSTAGTTGASVIQQGNSSFYSNIINKAQRAQSASSALMQTTTTTPSVSSQSESNDTNENSTGVNSNNSQQPPLGLGSTPGEPERFG